MDIFDLSAKLTLDSSDYESGIKQARGSASGFASALGKGLKTAAKVGAAAIATATTAVAGFAASAVKVGMSFDSSMSQVAATMGTTVDEIQELRDFAQEMGATTAFSATQAAEALNYMALAGYDAETSMEILPNVLNLAAAGAMELSSASDMLTDSQSALGLSLDETSELVDKMAMAASKSNTSVAQLGDAILTVGGTAKNLKGGTTELATALGILADAGIKGAEGGTALRNIILSLTAPTENATEALNALGVAVFDTEGNMRSLNEIFGDMDEALATLTQEERMAALSEIFNTRDMKSAEALLANVGDRWDELSGYIDDAAGAAQRMADTQLDNLEGDVTLLKSAFEGAQIAISDQLTPALREFVQLGTDGLGEVTEALEKGDWSAAGVALGNAIADALKNIGEYLPDLTEVGIAIVSSIVQGLFENAPELLTSLGTVISDAFSNLATDENGQDIADFVVNLVTTIANFIAENAPIIIPAAVRLILALIEGLSSPENVELLTEAAIALLVGLAEAMIAQIPIFAEYIPRLAENIITTTIVKLPELLGSLGEGIWQVIADALDTVGGEGTADSVLAWFAGIPDAISTFFSETIPNVISDIVSFFEGIPEWFEGLPERIGYALGTAIGTLIQWGADALNWVQTEVPKIIDDVVNFFSELPEKLWEWLSNAVEKIGEFTSDMWNKIQEEVPKIIDDFVKFFTDLPENLKKIGEDIITGLWNGISGAWNWLVEQFSGLVGGLIKGVKDTLGIKSPSKVFASIGENIALGLERGFDASFGSVEKRIVGDIEELAEKSSANVSATWSAEQTAATSDADNALFTLLSEIKDKIGTSTVVLDSGEMVGFMDASLGTLSSRKARAGSW